MKKHLLLLMVLCLLLPMATASAKVYLDAAMPDEAKDGDFMRITVFRSGESDACLLEIDGEVMMIDSGANPWREKLRDGLADRGIDHMKYFFNTHPHDDHIDGFYRLMQYGVTADEFVSVFPANFRNDLQKRTVEQCKKSGVPYRQLFDGDQLTCGGAALTVYRWEKGKTINALSPLIRLQYGDCVAMFCSDIIGDTQKFFLKHVPEADLKADIIKTPHHGLAPFVTEFLTAVDPEFIWCNNYNNDKVRKTRNQADYRDLPIMFSGVGTIIMECDGTDWYIRQTVGEF